MAKYSMVVVGTDGSLSSLSAVRTAAELAATYGADLGVVCAYFQSSGSVLSSPRAEHSAFPVVSEDTAREYLDEARGVAIDEGLDAEKISLYPRSGSPIEALVEALQETNADLLVVGNRGVHSLSGRVFGNVPSGVLRKASVDVMIVHTDNAPR